ncbi:MAG TPA: ABC transporter permease [Acidobacteriota bacterium]|nr:ABC transporter permease [Acidobacteriota bacterium]
MATRLKNATFADALYRSLLLVYPAEFRREYGREMTLAFRDRYHHQMTKRGLAAALGFWLNAVADVIVTAPGEHMQVLWRDCLYALRIMWQWPTFSIVAVTALALGIGANSAIFSVVNATLLKPLPYKEPQRLIWISGSNLPGGIKDESASGPDFLDWRSRNHSLEDLTCFAGWQPVLTNQGEPARIPGGAVSAGFFHVLGVPATLGRTFALEDDQPGKSQVVVLSYGTWQRWFGGDRQALGKSITLNGSPYTIIGVMPAQFLFPSATPSEIWTVYDSATLAKRGRRGDHLGVIGRLKNGINLPLAHAELNAIAAALEKEYPETNTNWRINTKPLLERAVGAVKPAIFVLLVSVVFLLLIACANVANLLLARSTSRQKEVALRIALGADRRRLIRQLLTESVLLALAGGTLGLILAYVGVKGLVAICPADVPRIRDVGIDRTVLGFNFLVSFFTGIIFGLVPALQSSTPDISKALTARGTSQGRRGGRMRNALTVAELALAVALLIGAGLLVKSYLKLASVDPGFSSKNLLTFRLSLPATKYSDGMSVVTFYEALLERLQALPGVRAAGAASDPPFLSDNYWSFTVQGRPPLPPGTNQDAQASIVTPDYFRTMGIPLRRGRMFSNADNRSSAAVALISETMARRHWHGEDPIGHRLAFDVSEKGPNWREIVGIVADTRSLDLGAEAYAQLYVPYDQLPQRGMTLLLRTEGDPMTALPDVRATVYSLDKEQPLHSVRPMREVLANSIAQQRLSTLLLSIFASSALALAAIGVYGVMAYSVSQRTHEMGVRIAMGAQPFDVLKIVVGQGMLLALIGIAIGSGLGLVLTRLMANLLFGTEPHDPAVFLSIIALLSAVAFLACYVPSRRAMLADPVVALRCE